MRDPFVFDPTLPADMLARLRESDGSLVPTEPGTPPVSIDLRREHRRHGALVFSIVAVAVVVLEVVGWAGLSVLVALGGMFAYVPTRLPAKVNRPKPDEIHWFWAAVGGLWMLWGLLNIGIIATFEVLSPTLLMMHTARYVHFFLRRPKGVLDFVARDRFIDPDDVGPAERKLLRRLRAASNRVREAQRLLGGAFDGTGAIMALEEERWLLARRMRRLAPLARELDEMNARAASGRVRKAMAPQRAVVDRSRAALRDRVVEVEKYVEPVREAIRAHREWEQILRLERGVDAYADVLADAAAELPGGLPGADDLGESAALKAARQMLDQRIDQAVEANRWLLEAARRAPDEG